MTDPTFPDLATIEAALRAGEVRLGELERRRADAGEEGAAATAEADVARAEAALAALYERWEALRREDA